MVVVHVLDGARFGSDQIVGVADVGQDFLPREVDDPPEPRDQMPAIDGEAAETEVGEAGVTSRLRVDREEAPSQDRVIVRGPDLARE